MYAIRSYYERDRRLARAIAALRYAANTHQVIDRAQCVDGKTWGYGWQTSYNFV